MSSRAISLLFCAAVLTCAQARRARPRDCFANLPADKIVDLSHSFNNQTIFWADDAAFNLNVSRRGSTTEDWYQADVIELATHGGTHLDAPIHFASGTWTVSEIPLERLLFVPIALVDVQEQASQNPVYELSVADIERWEEQHGRLPDGALLVERTGRAQLWPDRKAYMGIDEQGWRRYPTFSPEAARFLTENRSIYGVGLDSPSVDLFNASATHRILASHNVYKLENLADLSRVPAKGARAVVLATKIDGASGAPARVVAILP